MTTIAILFIVVLLIVFATIKYKISPFFTLIAASILTGYFFGFEANNILTIISEGFGKTLSSIGLIIAFGATMGVFLEKNGGTKVISERILKWFKPKQSPIAINIIGFIISIPVFCDSGFVVLSSLNRTLSKKTGISLVIFAIALSTGLYAAHVFVPPTPGPLAAAAVIEADLGLVILLGLVVAIPVSLTGLFWASFVGKRIKNNLGTETKKEQQLESNFIKKKGFKFWQALLSLLLPIVLIALKSIAEYPTAPLGNSEIVGGLIFLGNPIIALLIGVFAVMIFSRSINKEIKNNWVTKALKESGNIILVTGAGGSFGSILRASNISEIVNPENSYISSGLLIAFLLAALLKTAQGSSTVSIITTAAIMAPLLVNFGLESEFEKALSVLAIGAGAMTVSHINDSYFWVVSQFSNLSIKTALRSHTMATLFQGTIGIILVLVLHLLFD